MVDKNDINKKLNKELNIVKELKPEDLLNSDWLLKVLKKIFELGIEPIDVKELKKKHNITDNYELSKKVISIQATSSASIAIVTCGLFSASEVTAIFSGGASIPAGVTLAAAEMIYLLKSQVNLVYSIASIYGKKLSPDNPEDLLLVLAIGLGLKSSDFLKRSLKELAPMLAKKISSEIIKKYSVPVANIAIGSTFNYLSTNAIGNASIEYFSKNEMMNSPVIKSISETVNKLNNQAKEEKSIFENILFERD